MKRFVIAFFLLFALPNTVLAMPEISKPAPAFSGQDINGKTVSLSDYKGKTVVLEWTNPGCPFVQKFYGAGKMQELQKAALVDGVVWISINSGAQGKQGHMTPEEAKKVTAEKGWSGSAYILDGKGEIGKAYGAKTTPHMFVIDKEGVLVYAGAIDDKESANPSDIATAKNYVSAALADIKASKPVAVSASHSYGCGVKY